MTVDKPGLVDPKFAPDAVSAAKARESQTIDKKTRQRVALVSQQNGSANLSAIAPAVTVSIAAKEMFNAVKSVSDDDDFDQDKVDEIRKAISSGRFPIDEERLAKKFLELEQQLGDLGT